MLWPLFIFLLHFRCKLNQIILIGFAGIIGASSIIFAVIATMSLLEVKYDILIIAGPGFEDRTNINLNEINTDKNHDRVEKQLKASQISPNMLIANIKRDNKVIIPKGDTVIREGDTLVILNNND